MKHSLAPRTRKYVKAYGFLSFTRNLSSKYWKKLINTATKTGLDVSNTVLKKIIIKTAEETGELIGSKVADKVLPKPVLELKHVEGIFILQGKDKKYKMI